MQERQELLESSGGNRLLKAISRYVVMGIVVVILAIYLGLLFFGPNSIEVLYELNVQKKALERNIKYLKHENARLQKEYFELKELEAGE